MQRGFDIDIQRKQWALETNKLHVTRAPKDMEQGLLAEPSGGVLAATLNLRDAFAGAATVPRKTPPAPVTLAEPAPETRAPAGHSLPLSGVLYAHLVLLAISLLTLPAFLNFGNMVPYGIAAAAAPLALPALTLHVLACLVRDKRPAAAAGAAALLCCVPLAILGTRHLYPAGARWLVYATLLLWQGSYSLSLEQGWYLCSLGAVTALAVPGAVVELSFLQNEQAVSLLLLWGLCGTMLLGLGSTAQYRRHVAGVALT